MLGLLICQLVSVLSFAQWMTTDYCSRSLVVGQVIMNEEVIESTERSLTVLRGDQELSSGAAFVAGESLTIKISNSANEYVFDANSGAQFVEGGCNGRRIANAPSASLVMPSTPSGPVRVLAAWAEGHSQVKLSVPFILNAPSSAAAAEVPAAAPKAVEEDKSRLRGNLDDDEL